MAAVNYAPENRAAEMQKLSEKLTRKLDDLRAGIIRCRQLAESARMIQGCGEYDVRIANAKLELERAQFDRLRAVVEHELDDFTVMWQELRAELDLAHVLAVTPE